MPSYSYFFHLLNLPSPKEEHEQRAPPGVTKDHNFGYTEIERLKLVTICFKNLDVIEIV